MAATQNMPEIKFDPANIKLWGDVWLGTVGTIDKKTGKPKAKERKCFDKKQGMDFGKIAIDPIVAAALSKMLGDIPVVPPVNQCH